MASMDESPPGGWTGRTPKTASANDQLDTENQLKNGPVPRPPKAPATPNSRQPGGKASRDPNATSAAVEADRRYATQEHQRKTRPSHDRISPRLAALNLDSVANEPPVEAPAPAQNSTSGVLASVSGAMTSAFASAAGAASKAVDAVASAVAGRDATFAVDEEVAVAAEPSIVVDESARLAADFELVVSSVNHAERLACAAAAQHAANVAKLRDSEVIIRRLERLVANGGTVSFNGVNGVGLCRVPGLLSFADVKGRKDGAKKTLVVARASYEAAIANVLTTSRDQVVGFEYDESGAAFAAALREAETDAEKLKIILGRGRVLFASSVTAQLSTGSPVRVLSEDSSGVLTEKRLGVLQKALRTSGFKSVSGTGSTLVVLSRIIRVVGEKLAEEPAADRARASARRFRSCMSVVDAALELQLFARLAAAWRPFASAPGHGPVGYVPFDAAERDRLRAVVESYQGKPANPIGHVRFGVPLEPGLLPGLSPPRGSAYLRPVDALSRLSIEELAASLAHGEKIHPHLYVK